MLPRLPTMVLGHSCCIIRAVLPATWKQVRQLELLRVYGVRCGLRCNRQSKDCCSDLGPEGKACGGASAFGTCGGPGSVDEYIIGQLRKRVPQETFSSTTAALSESDLQKRLMSGHPVGRVVPGHIDAVVGCRVHEGQQQYLMWDSLTDAHVPGTTTGEYWFDSYSDLVTCGNPSGSHCWTGSIYAVAGLASNNITLV